MPDWFYPLMLVVILAGYVFLFLQARRYQVETSDLRDEMTRRLKRIDDRLEALPGKISAPPEVLADPPGLAALQTGLEELSQAVEALQGAVATPPNITVEAPPPAEGAKLPPTAVARRFLLEEGFSQARFGDEESSDGQVRLSVTALRGDEFRSGYVIVEDQEVVDASLKVPTAFFP